MRITTIAVIAAFSTGFAGTALADRPRCPAVPAQQWLSIEQVVEKAQSLGYSVRQAKQSKGCWKVEGYDRNGAEIEIHFDPQSGDVVNPRGPRPPAGG